MGFGVWMVFDPSVVRQLAIWGVRVSCHKKTAEASTASAV